MMSQISVTAIPAFADNYIWLIDDGTDALVVDPGQAKPVTEVLVEKKLNLKGLLITHHHPDHIGGLKELTEANKDADVFGFANANYAGVTKPQTEGDVFKVLGIEFQCIEVPGHTLDHIAFFCTINSEPTLFCGDTLFSGGCGRLFEGTAKQMHHSLSKLKNLPSNTKIYCAHEYTLNNLKFALTLMPKNEFLLKYIRECEAVRADNQPTIPCRLETELNINPFLREFDAEIIDNLARLDYKELDSDVNVFAAIRQAKDRA